MKPEPSGRNRDEANAYPEVRHSPILSLSDEETSLLARVFADSDQILVERELHAGFSGARVLLIRPGTGRAQVVVKFGPPSDLNREWLAYRTLVADYSPQNTARIQEEPILSDNRQRAVLRYTFAGGDPR